MADPLRVDPVTVHLGSSRVGVAVDTAATAFAAHEEALAEAGAGWVGSSREALTAFTSALAARHAAHCSSISELSPNMTVAAVSYTTADTDSSDAVAKVAEAMDL